MPFYIRKSVSVGPFRFNLSKSGIGVSAGIKGLRIGTGPKGHYIHAGRGGLYYRSSIGSRSQTKPRSGGASEGSSSPPLTPASPRGPNRPPAQYSEPNVQMIPVSSEDVLQMQDARFSDVLADLRTKQGALPLMAIAGWGGGALTLFAGAGGASRVAFFGLLTVVAVALGCLPARQRQRQRRDGRGAFAYWLRSECRVARCPPNRTLPKIMPLEGLTLKQILGFIVAAIAATLPATAQAQTQVQQDRLNRVAQYVVTAPMCAKLGMKLDVDLPSKAEVALKTETEGWGVSPPIVEQLKQEAAARQGRIFATDLTAATDRMTTDAQLRKVKSILIGYGRTCLAAASDPIFASLIIPPPGFDLETAATDLADSLLEGGGLASWQTPAIQTRGDLMMVAGTCRSKIGAARSDALVRHYGVSDDPRIRNYYSRSFDEGLADPSIIGTLAGCNRAIARYRKKLN